MTVSEKLKTVFEVILLRFIQENCNEVFCSQNRHSGRMHWYIIFKESYAHRELLIGTSTFQQTFKKAKIFTWWLIQILNCPAASNYQFGAVLVQAKSFGMKTKQDAESQLYGEQTSKNYQKSWNDLKGILWESYAPTTEYIYGKRDAPGLLAIKWGCDSYYESGDVKSAHIRMWISSWNDEWLHFSLWNTQFMGGCMLEIEKVPLVFPIARSSLMLSCQK